MHQRTIWRDKDYLMVNKVFSSKKEPGKQRHLIGTIPGEYGEITYDKWCKLESERIPGCFVKERIYKKKAQCCVARAE